MPRRKGHKARELRIKQRVEEIERLRNPKTPAAQVSSDAAYPNEEEEEAGAGTMRPSSDPLGDDGAAAIAVQLGVDTSSALSAPPNARRSDGAEEQRHSTTTDMGANQSREEVNRNIRNAASRLQKGSGGSGTSKNASGKLRKPSAGTVWRLAPPNAIHSSPYDALPWPEKRPTRRMPAADKAAFSPVQNQQTTSHIEQQSPPSARRSGRVQAQQEAQETAAARSVADRWTREQPVEEVDADAIYRDRFPDALVRQHLRAELDVPLDAQTGNGIEITGDDGGVQVDEADHDEHSVENPIAKKRGRPPKRSNFNDAHSGSEALSTEAAAARNTSTSTPAIFGQSPGSQRASSARAQRMLNELTQRHGSGRVCEAEERAVDPPKQQQTDTRSEPHLKLQTNSGSNTGRDAANQTQPRRSARVQNASKDVNQQQRTAGNAGLVDNSVALADDPQPHTAQPEESYELPDRPVVLRPDELQFDEAEERADRSAALEDEESEARSTRKRRRKPAPQGTPANTGAKRKKKDVADDEYEEQAEAQGDDEQYDDEQYDDEEDQAAARQRLWGNWLELKKVKDDARYVGCKGENEARLPQNMVELTDEDVEAACKLCTEANRRYHRLLEGDSDPDPASVLTEIGERIDGLRGRNDDFPTNFESKLKTTNIYAYLLPALATLVFRAATCYEILDQGDVPSGEISMAHLQVVQNLILMTLQLETAAKDLYKARPDTNFAVVRVVHDSIAVPLRNVSKAFQKIHQRHRAEVAATQRRQEEAQHRALQLEQEERRSRQAAELQRVRQKWEQLHRERMAAEGGMIKPAKMVHLRMPDPNLDEDFDGNAFDRVSVFHPRVGPPPGLIARAKQIVWTEGELRALEDGLRRYQGRMVYERIFREWCPRGRMLNPYSVTEIVAAAEVVKEYYEGESREQGLEVEKWVTAIPMWSKRHAIGKENEDEAMDGEGTTGDAAAATGSGAA